MIIIDLSGSDKNLVNPKKLEESLRTNRKGTCWGQFCRSSQPPLCIQLSRSSWLSWKWRLRWNGDSLMWNFMFEPAIVRRALEEHKFSFLHLLLMWPGHLQHLKRVRVSSGISDNLHKFKQLVWKFRVQKKTSILTCLPWSTYMSSCHSLRPRCAVYSVAQQVFRPVVDCLVW